MSSAGSWNMGIGHVRSIDSAVRGRDFRDLYFAIIPSACNRLTWNGMEMNNLDAKRCALRPDGTRPVRDPRRLFSGQLLGGR